MHLISQRKTPKPKNALAWVFSFAGGVLNGGAPVAFYISLSLFDSVEVEAFYVFVCFHGNLIPNGV